MRVTDGSCSSDTRWLRRWPVRALVAAGCTEFVFAVTAAAGIGARDPRNRSAPPSRGVAPTGLLEPGELAFDLVGATGGAARALAVRGDLAYVGAGTTIDVYDVSVPAAPRPVGGALLLADEPGWIASIALVGSHAYASVRIIGGARGLHPEDEVHSASRAGRLWVFDLSDPRAPVQVADVPVSGDTGRIAVTAGRLVVPSVPELLVFDVAHPAEPRLIEAIGDWHDNDVVVSDGLAFGVDGQAHVEVVDLSSSAAPHAVGRLMLDGRPEEVAAVGRIAYATIEAYETRLAIVDATDPVAMKQIGSFDLPKPAPDERTCTPQHIWTADGALAVTTLLGQTEGAAWGRDMLAVLTLVDVADPTDPRTTATYQFEQGVSASDVVARDGRMLLTVTDPSFGTHHLHDVDLALAGGLRVLDTRAPTAIREIGRTVPLARAWRVIADGDLLYVAESANSGSGAAVDRLHVLSVSGSGALTPRGVVAFPPINGMVLAPELESRILIATADSQTGAGVVLGLDVRDPDHPQQIGRFVTTDRVTDVAWSAPHALALTSAPAQASTLAVIDLTDADWPSQIGALQLEGGSALAVDGRHAYVSGCGSAGLCVVDLSDPHQPRVVPHGGGERVQSWQIAASRGFVFATWGRSEPDETFSSVLTVIDAIEPSRWHVAAEADITYGGPTGLFVQRGILAATAFWNSRFVLYDVADPASPRLLGSQATADSETRDVAVVGCRIAVADALGGVQVYQARRSGTLPPSRRPHIEFPTGSPAVYLPRAEGGVTCPLDR